MSPAPQIDMAMNDFWYVGNLKLLSTESASTHLFSYYSYHYCHYLFCPDMTLIQSLKLQREPVHFPSISQP